MPIKRDLNSYLSQIQNAQNGGEGKKSYKVEHAFTPVLKDDKYSIVMRFLPSNPNEFRPFVENRTHMFQLENGLWFGCDCLSKFGKSCPICDYNRLMWKKYGKEEGRNHVLGKYKPKYVSNVLIVRNPNAPETEGKVFRFEYGPLIMKLISDAAQDHEDPEAGLVKGFNPFDWKNGANFIYEGIKAGKFTKNDTSHFGNPKPINRWDGKQYIDLTDEEIDKIESQLYTLEDCEHKEEDVKDYQAILDSYLKKNGSPLPLEGVAVASNTTSNANVSNTSNSDDDDEIAEDTSDTSSASVEEDTDDFFAKLSGN